jgi:ribulose-bisphosphate carboxylase large chain
LLRDRIFTKDYDPNKYFTCEYFVKSEDTLENAAFDIAVGQSIGNPSIRNDFETDRLVGDHCCLILQDKEELQVSEGKVKIAYPLINIDLENDGVSQILCFIQGGHLDIKRIRECRVLDIDFPESAKLSFKNKAYGFSGTREYLNYYDKPLFGCIVKPKTGLTINEYQKIIASLIENGANFIKEDEILSSPAFLPLEKRVKAYKEVVGDHKLIYAFCINCDPHDLERRLNTVYDNGGNAIHLNFWSGFGAYNSIKRLRPELFLFYQKSGITALTDPRNPNSISWKVMVKLGIMCGIDGIHAGMLGGYSNDEKEELDEIMNLLNENDVIPSLSCGFHPGLVDYVNSVYGNNYMANVGGSIYGHPGGFVSGVKAMRQAIDKNLKEEYNQAIEKWGKI